MKSYYCIVSLPGIPVRDIIAVSASDDADAQGELARVARQWPGLETATLYEGERVVAVQVNPASGFTAEPLTLNPLAA